MRRSSAYDHGGRITCADARDAPAFPTPAYRPIPHGVLSGSDISSSTVASRVPQQLPVDIYNQPGLNSIAPRKSRTSGEADCRPPRWLLTCTASRNGKS